MHGLMAIVFLIPLNVEKDDDDEPDHHAEGEILVERRLHCAAKYIIRDFRYGAISPSSNAAK